MLEFLTENLKRFLMESMLPNFYTLPFLSKKMESGYTQVGKERSPKIHLRQPI